MTELIIVGDEAFTSDEWQRRQDRLSKDRERSRDYYAAHREERAAYFRAYQERHRDRLRVYKREYMRRKRKGPPADASLHDLRCTGPTKAAGCRCKKIPLYRREAA